MFSKTLESALSAMTCLARAYDEGQTPLTATQIADSQELNRPIVAKLLTSLSRAGLVVSKPGPNGGFFLARPPVEIRLMDVADSVGYRADVKCCVFGPQWGEPGNHCPLHDRVCQLLHQVNDLLESNTLESFADGE